MDIAVTKTVNATPERLREYLGDVRNDIEWRKNTQSCELVSGDPGKVGAQFRQSVLAMGNATEVTVTIKEATDERLHFLGEGGMMPLDVYYDLKAADGGTDVTLTISVDIPPAMAKMAGRMIEAENVKDLDALAAALDAS